MSADIPVHNNEGAGRFEVVIEGDTAFAEYRVLPDGLLFPHTVVPAAFEGRGVGSALAQSALGWAREQGVPVIPTCSFIAGYIARHPEFHDLVHPDYRTRLGLQ